ncbi:MAG: hypothetical protein B7Z75_10225 [Acidocella sp. 20-57-95]|nr:MAG: hypothetical protein B7Z75_10225 [Acidocella sp. 20-57-95]OYV62272.1 MAG: hypothetical protein B7Z71_01925 [Acidocella sp. 21-58-7]HQT63070.1 Spy/CpxP family protein refolding chaperone [Acidocella sp.]
MKQNNAVRAATILAAMSLAVPAFAQTTTATPPAPTMAPPAATTPMAPAPMAAAPMAVATPTPALPKDAAAKLEAHIKALHAQLKITAAEEPQWQQFADVMRTNAAQMHQAFESRAKVSTMTAPENMQSYADLAKAHADGMQTLAAAFSTLYASFPPAQQKLADKVFQDDMSKRAMKK